MTYPIAMPTGKPSSPRPISFFFISATSHS
jgi:hypothetical protein